MKLNFVIVFNMEWHDKKVYRWKMKNFRNALHSLSPNWNINGIFKKDD